MKYCPNCGKELFDEAVFCPGCKYSIQNNYKVKVLFEKDIYLNKPKVTVNIDGQNEHLLQMGDGFEVTLNEGNHTVFVKMGFRKNSCKINLTHDVILKIGIDRVMGGVELSEIRQ